MIEESIKSVDPPFVPASEKPIEHSSKNLEDSSSSVGPKMRRVKNPYGSSDLSASIKSSQSVDKKFGSESIVSQSKSKRKIEIEKLSEDSYQDDEFEDTVGISQSHEKTLLQKQLQQKQMIQQQQKKAQTIIKGKKDATPIKEEDIEDDTSAYDEDIKKKTLKRHESPADQLFDRDEREDDALQDDLKIIERESKISRSGTNSVPIDASVSDSGFVPSMIEKARNLGELSNTMKSSERTSLLSPMN